VVAKAPVPGIAKTRLAPAVGSDGAALLAAAALLDTVAAAGSWAHQRLLSLDGRLRDGSMAAELAQEVSSWQVVDQPAGGLDVRLAAALTSACRLWGHRPVVLIGMDTPQATPDDFERLDLLCRAAGPVGAAIGPAVDGGWWGLAVSDPALGGALVGVPMSTERTCELTVTALCSAGAAVRRGSCMRDMDTIDDLAAIAATRPQLRVAQTAGRLASAVALR